ncbi:MAG: hypothetical protein BMS9Abin36_0969 [Gammaproteobacteria bacterium]|nr:MAG: hypothetical protein BMS9Abin36_0969 [Gammaproteobacteria bacterium]
MMLVRPLWRGFCQTVTRIFYRRCEVEGLEYLPTEGGVLLCANHANALADAVILQSVSQRIVHPLARSGLFRNPLLRPILSLLQAVPIYRRQDVGSDTTQNIDSFARCYELFTQGEILLVFPEGQSHSDSQLREVKTGAARMALGARQSSGLAPTIVPVGLMFTGKGKFRSSVLVKFGPAITAQQLPTGNGEDDVRALTQTLSAAMGDVTLNADSWDELDLIQRLERFFAMRHGKYRKRSLDLRFRAMKKLGQAHAELQRRYPIELERLNRHLHQFERQCRRWGIHDYHLTVSYRPMLVTRFLLRSLFILAIILPLALWGLLNSYAPFMLTRHLARLGARGTDQYDTAKMVLGLFLFPIFWGLQISVVYSYFSETAAWWYALSLPPTAAAVLMLRRERERILENMRVFFLFVRRKKLRRYLEARRQELEKELAQLVRMAKAGAHRWSRDLHK